MIIVIYLFVRITISQYKEQYKNYIVVLMFSNVCRVWNGRIISSFLEEWKCQEVLYVMEADTEILSYSNYTEKWRRQQRT